MEYLNLGILAHVDAGKTSLTERLLYNAGVIDRVGRVDSGDTQTDSMDLERQRGITIRAAVVSFPIDDLTVNLVDTPGHSDFIGEVERVMRVLDGAILVISAVEGIQSQTRVLMRTLTRLGIPVLLFVNKIDRNGARYDELLTEISAQLTACAVPMTTVSGLGSRQATVAPRGLCDRTLDLLADSNDVFLARHLNGHVGAAEAAGELARQSRAGLVHPVYFGSATHGVGVTELLNGIRHQLPSASGHDHGEPQGTVFKVDRENDGRKIAYVRMLSGSLHPRSHPLFSRHTPSGPVTFNALVTRVSRFVRGSKPEPGTATAGSVAVIGGPHDMAIGDAVGDLDSAMEPLFARPSLETVVNVIDPKQRIALLPALRDLAQRDPLVDPHLDESTGDISVKLYGEVQKEVIASLLANEFGIDVMFDRTQVIHIERPTATASAVEEMGRWAGTHFAATIGLRMEPATPATGIDYGIEVERGSLPAAFHTVIEDTVRDRLQHGRFGWEVTDCRVRLTHSGFDNAISNGGDFRGLTTVLIERILRNIDTEVCEPIHRYDLDFPQSHTHDVLHLLLSTGARINGHIVEAETAHIRGTVPATVVHDIETALPTLTAGQATFVSALHGFRPVAGSSPPRRKTAHSADQRGR